MTLPAPPVEPLFDEETLLDAYTDTAASAAPEPTGSIDDSAAVHIMDDLVVAGRVFARGFMQLSDERAKTDIERLPDARAKLAKIGAYVYKYCDPLRNGDRVHIGVLAQEVRKQFPELVHEGADGYLRVNYSELVAPLIEAFKGVELDLDTLKVDMRQLSVLYDRQMALLQTQQMELQKRQSVLEQGHEKQQQHVTELAKSMTSMHLAQAPHAPKLIALPTMDMVQQLMRSVTSNFDSQGERDVPNIGRVHLSASVRISRLKAVWDGVAIAHGLKGESKALQSKKGAMEHAWDDLCNKLKAAGFIC
eukprot:TRINITY_DN4670_c0_g1_i1.p1 TRINITY_DN4670_c0_g1~~TRINITY_DN4670_c0_g1_i1.p1  ORF type:complete len:306 (-),score=78.41 TRINITY_DN4670_c0_g1_i1:105-1022(-)